MPLLMKYNLSEVSETNKIFDDLITAANVYSITDAMKIAKNVESKVSKLEAHILTLTVDK